MSANEKSQTKDEEPGNLKTIGSAIMLALFIRVVLFEAFEIEGPSMEPTLLNGDRVVVAKYIYGLFLPFMTEAVTSWGQPDVGDVIIVKSPRDNVDIVKRVIGLPGDTIEIRDGGVPYRNGVRIPHMSKGACEGEEVDPLLRCEWVEEKLGEHTFTISHLSGWRPPNQDSVKVPPDHVYVLGDHRDRSNDSRALGPIPVKRIKGQVLSIYWSSSGSGAGLGCVAPSNLRTGRMFQGVD